jgi:hypothetical protein
MKRLALALVFVCAAGCGGAPNALKGNLHWFATCRSLCIVEDGGVGGNGCVDHEAGESCSVEGEMCGASGSCEGPLVCAATDPLAGVVCPL